MWRWKSDVTFWWKKDYFKGKITKFFAGNKNKCIFATVNNSKIKNVKVSIYIMVVAFLKISNIVSYEAMCVF